MKSIEEIRLACYAEAKDRLEKEFSGDCRTYMWPGRMPSYPTNEEIKEEAEELFAFLTKDTTVEKE